MMSKYIAFTLGPISRVISYAQKTKELWAASYLFSSIGEILVEPFYQERKREFLLPFLFDKMFDVQNNKDVGVFPDRYVFKSESGDWDLFVKKCDELYQTLNVGIASALQIDLKHDNGKLLTYLKHTIKIYAFEKEFDENVDVTKACEQILSSMENQDTFTCIEERNYLYEFFQNVGDSFLTNHAQLKSTSRIFNTIREYSAAELRTGKGFMSDTYLDSLSTLRPYHNYIAFVQADGDNFTETIKSLKERGLCIADFSKAIYLYATELRNLLSNFGGRAIYIGGDDLLFFAPVFYNGKTIFSLIQQIDALFSKHMNKFINAPTLSFGLSMTYYKFPMAEAIEKSESLLNKAKNEGKNHLCWQLVKHSGQIYQTEIDKSAPGFFDDFLGLVSEGLNKVTQSKKGESTEDILNSYTYWMMQNETMLAYIMQPLITNPADKETVQHKLLNYVNNSLNETIHEQMKDYVTVLVEKLVTFMMVHKDAKKSIALVCATLRFVGFLKSERL